MWPRPAFEHSTFPFLLMLKRFLTEPFDFALGMGSLWSRSWLAARSGASGSDLVPRSQAPARRATIPGAEADRRHRTRLVTWKGEELSDAGGRWEGCPSPRVRPAPVRARPRAAGVPSREPDWPRRDAPRTPAWKRRDGQGR